MIPPSFFMVSYSREFEAEESRWSRKKRKQPENKPVAAVDSSLAVLSDSEVETIKREIQEQSLKNAETLHAKYEIFIDFLKLSNREKQKLKEMMSDENYRRAVKTAQELDPQCKIPTYTQIANELMSYTEEKLKDICDMMMKPTLIIVPNNSFDEKIAAMGQHKHRPNTKRPPPNTIYRQTSGSPYLNAPKMKKVRVSIVDGVFHPPQLQGVSIQLGPRREYLTQKFAKKKMRNIDKDEMATLLQQSLIEAEETGDRNKIIDNQETGNGSSTLFGTCTVLDPKSLANSELVAFVTVDSYFYEIDFCFSNAGSDFENVRGRATLQILEF